MEFSLWLFLEDQKKYVRTRRDVSPKNPDNTFLVLYGADKDEKELMFSIKDELKKMGFRYFAPNGTYSIFSAKVDDAARKRLADLGVDMTGYDSTQSVASAPSKTEESPADENLERMQRELSDVVTDDPKAQRLIDSIERMIEQVANGADEAAKQAFIRNFFDFAGRFYNYSLHNQFLIWIQSKGRARHVAGARQWEQKFGRTVRDWNSPITILVPIKKEKEVMDPSTGAAEKKQRVFFTTKKIYDVTSTVPIPGHPKTFEPVSRKQWSVDSNEDVEEVKKYVSALDAWVAEKNIKINYEELDAETGGHSAGGRISINNLFKGVNLFSTYVHEVAHELLHWEKEGKRATRKEKEIDAETTAFIVLNHFGFETKDTSNYLALWQAKGDDVRARRRNIQKAAMEIINGIKGKIDAPEQEEAEVHEESSLADLYSGMLDKKDLQKYSLLSKRIDMAYERGDHRTAERLEAELETLIDDMDNRLEDSDDGSTEDDEGEPENDLDRDWSVQEEMARIYARYLSGDLDSHLDDDSESIRVDDPEEARRNGFEVRQMADINGKPTQSFYRLIPATKERLLANMLRGAIWESPNLALSRPKVDFVKSMTDQQIIDAAKDAYEWKKGLLGRIRNQTRGHNL